MDSPALKLITTGELYAAVVRFRKALEAYSVRAECAALHQFPCGSCGIASDLLGTYLVSKGFGEFSYVLGFLDNASHAWLAQGRLIVDITADQFDDIDSPVILTKDLRWHGQFGGQPQRVATIAGAITLIQCDYAGVLKLLNSC